MAKETKDEAATQPQERDVGEGIEIPTAAVLPIVKADPRQLTISLEGYERAVDKWVNSFIHNSPVARSTEAYNHVRSVLPELYKLLKQEV